MCAEDAAFVESPIDGFIRESLAAYAQSPLGARVILRLDSAVPLHNVLWLTETVAGQSLIVKALSKNRRFHHESLDSR